jgi:hypothetical protein
MRRKNGDPARVTVRYSRLGALLAGRRRARLTRFDDPASAEDDYFRFANRNN